MESLWFEIQSNLIKISNSIEFASTAIQLHTWLFQEYMALLLN
jgi:hypothetical protein